MPLRASHSAGALSGRQVCVAGELAGLSHAVHRALRAISIRPIPEDDLSPEDLSAVVCGWPKRTPSDQRRLAAATVESLAPHRIVVVTDLEARAGLKRLAAAGIHGLVLAWQIPSALVPTLGAVFAGQVCIPALIRESVDRRPLSLREREILALVIMGLSNSQIASRLHLAESTVKSHLASTFDKLGVRSRAEASELVTDPQEMLTAGVIGLSATADGEDDGDSTR